MSSVAIRPEAGREWILQLDRVPVAATRSRDCAGALVAAGARVPVGAVVVECLRGDGGVLAAVVLPNGYPFPTGRIAPRAVWFPMLKSHLREWLAAAPAGRVFRIADHGVQAMAAQLAAGRVSADVHAAATAKLAEFRAAAAGELPPGAAPDALLAGFYTWLTGAAAQAGMTQADAAAVVAAALQAGKRAPVPDLDPDLFPQGYARLIDV